MSDYNPPDPLPPPLPIFNNVNWVIPDLQTGGGGGAGTQGSQGFQGVGLGGQQGRQGFQGFVGFQGTQGFNGVQGTQGLIGSTGSTGAIGGVRSDVYNTFASLAPTILEIGQKFSWITAGGVANTSFACCSGNGRYIYITSGYDTAVSRSDNYGKTFTNVSIPTAAAGFGLICSADGRIVYGGGQGGLMKSTNYGQSYSLLSLAVAGPILCSSDGKYVYTSPYIQGSIYRSTDYGATFTIVGTNTGHTLGGQGCISASGQFIIFPQAVLAQMLFSNDYGNTWSVVALPASYRSASISSSGQFISICSWFSNAVMVSDDYGVSFRTISIPTSPSGMALSATGQYQFVGSLGGSSSAIYFSDDWGNTWNTLPTPNTATDNAFNVYCSGSGQILGYAGGGNTYVSVSYLQTLPQAYGYTDPIFIGLGAGLTGQQLGNVAIGFQSGQFYQNSRAVAIGYQAGMTGQGADSIAIGYAAGATSQASNSICLNAGGTGFSPGTTGFFVKPVRNGPTGDLMLSYNNTSGEIFYTQRSLFGQYFDTTNQANSGATGNTITFNTTDFNRGISLVSTSQITVSETGYYSVAYSLQYININSQEQYVDVWFEKNGTVMPNTNSEYAITRNQSGVDGKLIASSTFFFNLIKNDYLQIRWFCSTLDVDLVTKPAGTYLPASPSAIVNIQLISS